MAQFPDKLTEIAHQIERDEEVEKTTVRSFLEWFGAQRRGYYVVQNIRRALETLQIKTDPDFEAAYIDELISFRRSNGTPEPATPILSVVDALAPSPSDG